MSSFENVQRRAGNAGHSRDQGCQFAHEGEGGRSARGRRHHRSGERCGDSVYGHRLQEHIPSDAIEPFFHAPFEVDAEQTFALHALLDREIPLVTLSGKAGTGKTLLALAAPLERRRHYHQILLARPVMPLSNRDIGFLSGDINSKLTPYMQPLYDNLAVIQNQYAATNAKHQRIAKLLEEEKLVIEARPTFAAAPW